MRALILAAGRGSRMGSKTSNKPKCLNILLGKTLLDWQLQSIKKSNINDILIVRGYKSEMISGDFDTYDNSRWSETNMVSSLFCAPISNKDTIVSYSDIVYNTKHIEKLKQAKGDIIITADKKWLALWSARFTNPLDDAESFKTEGNHLVEIGKKTNSVDNIEAQYMGLIKLSPTGWIKLKEIFESFPREKQDKMDMTSMLNEMLSRNEEVNVVYVEGKWCEADTYEDILVFEKMIAENKEWSHDWR